MDPEPAVKQGSKKLARDARQLVDAVASRIPKVRAFRKGIAEPGKIRRLLVISDIHLGDRREFLTRPEWIEALVAAIRDKGQVDELVLLGDIFDFWQVPVQEALSRAGRLMKELFMLDNVGRMVYVPGNHDHHVFRMFYSEQTARRLRDGKLDPPGLALPLTRDCPVIAPLRPGSARVPFFMAYPMHRARVGDKNVLLTHGHLLGFFERSLWSPRQSVVSKLILSRSESLGLEDMERFISPFYEMLTLSALVPGVVGGGYRVYRVLSRAGKMMGLQGASRISLARGRTVEQNAAEIEALLEHFCPEKPDYFVYGHTHRSGTLKLPLSGTTAVNTGCWLDDDVLTEKKNTLLEIAGNATLHQVELNP